LLSEEQNVEECDVTGDSKRTKVWLIKTSKEKAKEYDRIIIDIDSFDQRGDYFFYKE